MIAKMDRLEIVCLRDVLPKVTAFMQEQGLVHIEEVPLAVEGAPGFLSRVRLSEEQRAELEKVEELHRMAADVAPLLATQPALEEIASSVRKLESMSDEELRDSVASWARQLRSLTRRKLNIQDNREVLSNFLKTLEAVEPLLGGRTVILGKDARAFVLKGEAEKALERLQERQRSELGPDSRLLHQRVSRNTVVGLLMYPPECNEAAGKILKEEHVPPVDLPDKDLRGASAREVAAKVREAIAKHQTAEQDIRRQIEEYSKLVGADLCAADRVLADRLARFGVVAQFAHSQLVGVIHGWIPSDEAEGFIRRLETQFPGQTTVTRLPLSEVDIHEVPTLLRNPPIFKPFELLLTLFKPPTYGTMDPTPLVAVSFILFYGFILGDVVYGIVVVLFALALRKKLGHIPAVQAAGTVGIYMGVSGIFFGVLYAEYAGNLGEKYLGLHPFWIHRSHDIVTLMVVAVVAGTIHVPLALTLGVIEGLRHHHLKHAMEKLGLLLGLSAVVLFALNFLGVGVFAAQATVVTAGLLFVGCVGLLIWSMGVKALVTTLEVISLAGNVLSYCRLMALGLAGVIIADLANVLGTSLHPLIGVPLAAVVHVCNIGLAVFSPTLHSLRLNYVEFLPKFYHPEGRNFKPFKKEASW